MLGLLVLLSCVHPSPPAVFPLAPPPVVELEVVEVEAEPADCTLVVPYRPGQGPACEGLVVPPVRLVELEAAEGAEAHYLDAWRRSHEGRLVDRAHATYLVDTCEQQLHAERRAHNLDRWVMPFIVTGALASGIVIGCGLGELP